MRNFFNISIVLVISINLLPLMSGCSGGESSVSDDGSPQSNGNTQSILVDGRGFFVLTTGDDEYYAKYGSLSLENQEALEGAAVEPDSLNLVFRDQFILKGYSLSQNGDTVSFGPISFDNTIGGGISSFSIDASGVVTVQYFDGTATNTHQLALSIFGYSGANWLEDMGNDIYASTLDSGPPIISEAGEDNVGIIAYSMEAVSIADDLLFPLLSIDGSGYFVLRDQDRSEPNEVRLLGNFHISTDGDLVDSLYRVVQGWSLDSETLERVGEPGDLNVGRLGPKAPARTQQINISVQLSSNSITESTEDRLFENWDGTVFGGSDQSLPIGATSYEFSHAIDAYDQLGSALQVVVYYDITSLDSQWEFLVTCKLFNSGGDSEVSFQKGSGALLYGIAVFDDQGHLTDISYWDVPQGGNLDITNNEHALVPNPDDNSCEFMGPRFFDQQIEDSEGALKLYPVFIIEEDFAVLSQQQDGYPAGFYETTIVDENGIVSNHYTNGVSVPVAQIGLTIPESPSPDLPPITSDEIEVPNSGGMGGIVAEERK